MRIKMKNKRWIWIGIILSLLGIVTGASIVTFIVTYSVPSQVSHTLAYGSVNGTCSSTVFWFVENDATLNGNQMQLNTTDAGGNNICQNNTISALQVQNNGNVRINVTLELNQSALTGVITSAGINSSSYEGYCSGAATAAPSNTTCKNITHSAPAFLAVSVGPGGNQSVWIWANFINANLGNGTNNSATNARIISTNSTSTN